MTKRKASVALQDEESQNPASPDQDIFKPKWERVKLLNEAL